MPRKLQKGWIQTYKDYVENQESPPIFHIWISILIISGAMKRNVWISRGAYTLYPNQYMFLITKSGSCRKSVAMELGMDLLRELDGIKIVYERASLEGLMDRMQGLMTIPSGEKEGRVIPDGSVFIHADELANLFGKASYINDLMSFLTAAYSSRSRLEFLTRNKGLCSIQNPCPSMMSGATPEQFGDIFPSISLASGFLGRVLLVVGERGQRIGNPSIRYDLRESLVEDLKDISSMYGEMVMSKETNKKFVAWYENLPPVPKGLPAFYERKHDHVLKTAMILSASDNSSMVIEDYHIEEAKNLIKYLEETLEDALEFVGATAESALADRIVDIVRSAGTEGISHSVLMRRVYRSIKGAAEFKAIIDTLCDSKRIKMSASGKAIKYHFNE